MELSLYLLILQCGHKTNLSKFNKTPLWDVFVKNFWLQKVIIDVREQRANSLEHTTLLPFQQKFNIFHLNGFSLGMKSVRLQVISHPLEEFIHPVTDSE